MPHKDGNNPGPKEFVRPRPFVDTQTLSKMGYSPERVFGVISPATGARKLAVILVQFPGAGTKTSGSYTLSSSDILGFDTTLSYMKNFYYEASYGKLNLSITYFYTGGNSNTLTGSETPFTLNTLMSVYGQDTDASLSSLIKDSLDKVSSTTLNASNYDGVIVAHAGYGNESTNNDGDIWSAAVSLIDSNGFATSKNGFTDGINIPARESASSPIGVTCHEFGHMLGLPDVYSTGISAVSKVGKWDLMDYGPWVNDGQTPTHPSVWNKKYLGWVTPISVNTTQSISDITSIQLSSTSVYQVPILGNPLEYFLVVFTTKTPYNPNPPGGGLLIWHVDEGTIEGTTLNERLRDNTINNYEHNTLDLVPADNTHPQTFPFGDATDPWPGLKTVFTTPESDSYSGQNSNVTLSDITFSQGLASMSLTNIAMTSIVSINKVINYPNPAGPRYPAKNSDTVTTFVFNLTKVSRSMSLSIYTLAGEKVIEVPGDKIHFRIAPSTDYKVIYEYDWDGKNGNAEDVAPGVYLYRLKADNEVKSGKLAIIR